MKVYQKNDDYSYTLGVFPTIQLLKSKPMHVKKVIISSISNQNSGIPIIKELCNKYHILIEISDKSIHKLSKKGNCFAIGVFTKYPMKVDNENHVVLVNPSDMGNMGTIIRTMVGFNYKNLVIIRPGVDVFDPKVIRASMGAIFDLNIEYYDSFETYNNQFLHHKKYPLMLKGAKNIHQIQVCNENKHSIIFGNESSGLSDEYLQYGKSIFIPHSSEIDSLNLPMAVGITLMHFSKHNFEKMNALVFSNYNE